MTGTTSTLKPLPTKETVAAFLWISKSSTSLFVGVDSDQQFVDGIHKALQRVPVDAPAPLGNQPIHLLVVVLALVGRESKHIGVVVSKLDVVQRHGVLHRPTGSSEFRTNGREELRS